MNMKGVNFNNKADFQKFVDDMAQYKTKGKERIKVEKKSDGSYAIKTTSRLNILSRIISWFKNVFGKTEVKAKQVAANAFIRYGKKYINDKNELKKAQIAFRTIAGRNMNETTKRKVENALRSTLIEEKKVSRSKKRKRNLLQKSCEGNISHQSMRENHNDMKTPE